MCMKSKNKLEFFTAFILKEDETPTSIGGELQQFSLGGSPISFQDKASGESQAWSVEECFAFDHAAARTPEAFLNRFRVCCFGIFADPAGKYLAEQWHMNSNRLPVFTYFVGISVIDKYFM